MTKMNKKNGINILLEITKIILKITIGFILIVISLMGLFELLVLVEALTGIVTLTWFGKSFMLSAFLVGGILISYFIGEIILSKNEPKELSKNE